MTPRRQGGFSLLEVLGAFSVLAISLGVLMQIFSRATLSTVTTLQYSEAASLAESLLGTVGTEIPLQTGAVSGRSVDGFDWEVTITQVMPGEDTFSAPDTIPYAVNATVLWRDAGQVRRLSFATLRLAATDAEPGLQ